MTSQPETPRGRETDSLATSVERARQRFHQHFDRWPRWIACAPGRVNLIGEHVDYNQGFVLPMAIERYTVIAADRSPSDTTEAEVTTRIYSANFDEHRQVLLPAASGPKLAGWPAYVQGVLAGCERLGLQTGPLQVVIDSTLPLGGGLSSSASLEVAVATLVEAVTGVELDALRKVQLCQAAEHDYAGVPCGIMDQFAATMAQANRLMLLDCRSLQCQMIPLEPPAPQVLIVNSNVHHQLADSQYAARRRECQQAAAALGVESLRDVTPADLQSQMAALPPVVLRRARHVVGEIQRTLQTAEAIQARDWQQAGKLMIESHESLRDDYEVSCRELDLLVDLSQQLGVAAGVYGARMTGGGFGGCIVSLVEPDAVPQVTQSLCDGYRQATGIEPSPFVTRPAAGARQL